MAAEYVFYGENQRGVSGDISSATGRAAYMVGIYAMGPEPIDLNGSARFITERAQELIEACRCPLLRKPFDLKDLVDWVRSVQPAAAQKGQSA